MPPPPLSADCFTRFATVVALGEVWHFGLVVALGAPVRVWFFPLVRFFLLAALCWPPRDPGLLQHFQERAARQWIIRCKQKGGSQMKTMAKLRGAAVVVALVEASRGNSDQSALQQWP